MNKKVLSFAVLMMGLSLLTACDNDDDDAPVMKPVEVSEGLFVVGSGNQRAKIDGNLSYLDYTKGTIAEKAFAAANGKSVGKTANFGMIYGQKLYIAVDGENTVWVCNRKTLKVEKQLSTTALMGTEKGISPRALTSKDGKVYLTCYGKDGAGVVAEIDTVAFNLKRTFSVGSYPDGITECGGYLFVANSDYGKNVKPSVSKIDLAAGTVSEIKDALITNPMQMVTADGAVYCLDYGTYDANWKQNGQGVRKITQDGKVTKIVEGTTMCTDGKRIYTANAPYGGQTKYYIFDIATGKTTEWEPANIVTPAVMAADPNTGNVFVVSYSKDPDSGYTSYSLPSYTNQYDAQGKLVRSYQNCAVGPISAVFNYRTDYVTE